MSEAKATIRNAGALMMQRGLHVVGAVVFATLVPRLMGPATFGRYALLTSVSTWFALLSGLGAASLMTRSVPRLLSEDDRIGLSKLLTNLLTLRAATAIGTATLYFLLIVFALGEPDLASAAFVAGGVFCRTVANVCFSFFLGMNQAARWGMGDLLRRWLTLVLVLIGFPVAGLRGACLGFLLANAAVLVAGLAGARDHLRWSLLDLTPGYLTPLLRIGLYFGAGNLLVSLVHRSGETVVRLRTGDFVQVGYYGAAYNVYLTAAQAIWQLALACAPFLILQVHRGELASVGEWLGRLLKWMVLAGMSSALGLLFVGRDAVPLVLGHAYRPVAQNLIPLVLALLVIAACSIGRLISLVIDRPGVSAVAAVLQLGVFWAVGLVLAEKAGSFGVCLAALVSAVAYAAYIITRLRNELPWSPRAALQTVALGALFTPLAALGSSWQMDVLLLAGTLAAYAALLFRLRIVRVEEISAVRELLRRQTPPAP